MSWLLLAVALAGEGPLDVVASYPPALVAPYPSLAARVERYLATERDRHRSRALRLLERHQRRRAFASFQEENEVSIAVLAQLFDPDHVYIGLHLSDLAQLYMNEGDGDRGLAAALRAVANAEAPDVDDPLHLCERLFSLAYVHRERGEPEQALAAVDRCIDVRPPDPGKLSTAHNIRGYLLSGLDRSAEAVLAHEAAVRAATEAGYAPIDHTISMNNLAGALEDEERFDEARQVRLDSLAIADAAFGVDHPETVKWLRNLAHHARLVGDQGEALVLRRRILRIREGELGPRHIRLLKFLDHLADAEDASGDLAGALATRERAHRIATSSPDATPVHRMGTLSALASALDALGRIREAVPLHLEVAALAESILSEDDEDLADALGNVGLSLMNAGDLRGARPYLERAHALDRVIWGEGSLQTVQTINNLAVLAADEGDIGRSIQLHEQSVAIRREHAPGTLSLAVGLNNLALDYLTIDRAEEARDLLEEVVAIEARELPHDHPDRALALGNLGQALVALGELDRAETLYGAVAELERALPRTHPSRGESAQLRALLAEERGDFWTAIAYHEAGLALREEALGARHLDVIHARRLLAGAYLEADRFDEALAAYDAVAAAAADALPAGHPVVMATLYDRSALHAERGDLDRALDAVVEAALLEDALLDRFLWAGSEAQRRAYVAELESTTDAVLTAHLQWRPDEPAAARAALGTLLRRRGRLIDAETRTHRIARDAPGLSAQAERLATVVSLAEAARAAGNDTDADAWEEEEEALRRALATGSAAYRVDSQRVTVDAVAAQLPEGTALLEFAVYRPLDVARPRGERRGAPRYAAYLVTADGSVRGEDLGPVSEIDADIAAFRRSIQQLDDDRGSARALYRTLLGPFGSDLPGRLWLAPEGELAVLPFDTLVDARGERLIRSTEVAVLASGRDLLRFEDPLAAGDPDLVVAGPDFGVGTAGAWAPLPHARPEGDALHAMLPGSTLRVGPDATEAAVRSAGSPRVLHIASHGYFDREPVPVVAVATRSSLLWDAAAAPVAAGASTDAGIVLAGANESGRASDDDGYLTASELARMDLRGTRLVVLSACDTGRGGAWAGDGQQGLRRALLLAGARTQVLSLWPVADDTSRRLMVGFYEALTEGEAPARALRDAKLALMDEGGRAARPYHWAAFVVSGDDAPLDGE